MNNFLELLHLIEKNDSLSQREMAERLGVALGLANQLLTRALDEGFLIADKSAHRHSYKLTPKGVAHKSSLAAEALQTALGFFKKVRAQYESLFKVCEESQIHTIALVGLSDLSTLASLTARSFNVRIESIFKDVHGIEQSGSTYDAFIVCDLEHPQKTYDALVKNHRVLVPDILYVSQKPLSEGVKS